MCSGKGSIPILFGSIEINSALTHSRDSEILGLNTSKYHPVPEDALCSGRPQKCCVGGRISKRGCILSNCISPCQNCVPIRAKRRATVYWNPDNERPVECSKMPTAMIITPPPQAALDRTKTSTKYGDRESTR